MKLFSSVLLFLLVSAIFAQESNPTSVAQNEATPTETIKEQLPLIKPAHQIGDEEVEDSSSHDHANDTLKSENATSAAPEPEASTSDETFPPEVADNDPFQETTTTATLNQTLATTKTENKPQPPSESTENVNGTESHETQAATQPTELEIVHEETLETEKTEEVTSHEAETSTEEHEPEVSPTQSENVAAVNETMHVDPSATAVVAEATISHESEAITEAATISTNLSNFHIEEGPLGIRKLSAYPTNASETVVEETSTALDVESSMNPDDADVFAADKGLFSAEATMRTSTEQHVNQPVVNSSDPLFPRFELPQQNSSRVEETTSLNGEMKHVELGGNPDEITKSEESQSTTEEGELALPILPPKPTDQSDSSIADEHSENSAETVSESESTHGDADKILPTNTSVPDQTESAEPHAEPEPEPTASSDSTTEPKSEPEPSAEPEPSSPANHEHEHMQTEHDHFSTPEPEPKAEPEPSPLPNGESPGFEEEVEKTSHEHTTEESTAVPEPKSEPEPQPEPEPSAEPTPNETKPMGKEHVHPSQADMDNAHKTRFSLRFPNIDFSKDFENPNSGLFKKLRDQVSDDLRQMFISVLGDNFLDLEIVSMREGSVIIEGLILTKEELTSPEVVAAKLEEVISKNGAQLGANRVDLTSISVNGIFSKGLSDSSGSIVSTTNSGYIVFGAIAVGLLIIVFSVFAIILFGVNSRRTNGNLKLKEELNLAENGRSTYNANAGSVNLMGFGNTSKSPGLNGSSNNSNSNNKTTGASSTAPPMVMTSSQFSTPAAFRS